jgi:hypothetical protein
MLYIFLSTKRSYQNLYSKDSSLPGCDAGISTGEWFTSFHVSKLRPSSDSIGTRIFAIETTRLRVLLSMSYVRRIYKHAADVLIFF